MIREIIQLGAVFVTGSGNVREAYPSGYPALFGDPNNRNFIPDLIVVGAVLGTGTKMDYSDAPWVTCYAPGYTEVATSDYAHYPSGYRTGRGTSLSSASVAGLAAYFRGLDSTLTTAASVKQRILALAYRRATNPAYANDIYPDTVVWNGQQNGGSVVAACGGTGSPGTTRRRRRSGQGGDSCPVAFPPPVPTLTFRTGAAQPTCAGAGCGSACAGFFCAGSPLTQNPDFLDPRNPDSVQNPDGPYYNDWDGTITRSTTTTTSTSTSTDAPVHTPTDHHPRPEAGHGASEPSWFLIFYSFYVGPGQGNRNVYYGFDDEYYTTCQFPDTAVYQMDYAPGIRPVELAEVTAYGKTCTVVLGDNWLYELQCPGWAKAVCTDFSNSWSDDGGDCGTSDPPNTRDWWAPVLKCTWVY